MFKLKKSLLRKQRKNESLFKYILSLFHLWLGLTSSLVIFIVCFTGCLYAFKTQIENIIYSDYKTVINNKPINIENSVNTFENQFGTPTQIIVHPNVSSTIEITSFSKQNSGVYAYLHPNTGELIEKQSATVKYFFHIVLETHRWMLVEDPGKTIVGIFVLIFLYMTISGLVMWFPKKKKGASKSFKIRLKANLYRINYDLHKVLGFYSALLLILISLTGLYVSFHWVKNLTLQALGGNSIAINDDNLGNNGLSQNLASSFNALFDDLIEEKKAPKKDLSINELTAIAKQELKNDGRLSISYPIEGTTFYTFKSYGADILTTSVYDELVLNQSGEIKEKNLFSDLPLFKQFISLAKPLHTGEIFGIYSITLYFFVSLIGCSLPITGFVIWWKKISR